jgi:hypothetical protein
MNGSDDHGVGHFGVAVEKAVGFVEAKVDAGAEHLLSTL